MSYNISPPDSAFCCGKCHELFQFCDCDEISDAAREERELERAL